MIAPLGQGLIPHIIKVLNEITYHQYEDIFIAHAVHYMGADAMPALTDALENQNDQVFRFAIAAITAMEPATMKTAVPALMKLLEERDGFPLYCSVIKALGEQGPDARDALPILKEHYSKMKSCKECCNEAMERAIAAIEGR